MISLLQSLVPYAYQFFGVLLTLYGLFVFSTLIVFFVHRRRHDWPMPDAPIEDWPAVTVQLPIYNEPRVAVRLLQAVADFDYPADRLQIQVLDDSTDQTASVLARQAVGLRRQRGLNISYHHRHDRTGYKAGALAAALPAASGEFIAVFDADFVPPPSWLRESLPALIANENLAFVQTRWAHLNRHQNILTAAQSLALDGHFVVEQQARSAAGLLQNFNGSGGLWRRRAIVEAGGWTADTVTEDLDLSYRAQLRGWRGAYLNQVAAPAELPPLISSFRRQQRRWAKGSAQTLRKLAPELRRSDRPLWKKVYAFGHLAGYATHLPLLMLLALTLPMALTPDRTLPLPFIGSISLLVSIAPFLLYAAAQNHLDHWQGLRRLWALPFLAMLSLGMSPAIGQSVWDGFRHGGGAFERTPKQGAGPAHSALPKDTNWRQFYPEMLALTYAILTLLVISWTGAWGLAPLPILFSLGCSFVLIHGIRDAWRMRPLRASAGGQRGPALASPGDIYSH
ncbi:MAG: glycosyltransferase [Caldilineales bacterium]|nr:glycosyltransferase [Caldilineales bacterium]